MGSRTNSGGTRSPARFSPPRGRGGARGVASHRGQLAGPPEGVGVAGAGPGAGIHAWGLCRPNPGGLTWGVPQIAPWGRRLSSFCGESTASTNGGCPVQGRGAPLAGVSRIQSRQTMHKRYLPPSRPGVGISARVLLPPPERVPIAAGFDRRRRRVREMKSPTDASSRSGHGARCAKREPMGLKFFAAP